MTIDERRHEHFVLKDGDRHVEFDGALLGHSTSERSGKSRWSEISIYRTRGGNFIVAGVGKTILAGESDRHWATVCERPQGVVEKLTLCDDDGTRYVPYTSRIALDQAIEQDDELGEAYKVEVVD